MPDFAEQESFKIQWSHRQDSKASPFSSLSASVNFASTSYERNNLNSLYAKLPGNVVNPATYDFPVIFKRVEFEIERLFAGDPTLVDIVIDAARELEANGATPGFEKSEET